MYVLFEVYLEQLTVEELLISEVGERRAARRVEPSQYHPCLAFVSFVAQHCNCNIADSDSIFTHLGA